VVNIDRIQWSSDPFDCLVIQDEDREVIMALVEARNGQDDGKSDFSFDDFIQGKGRGINLLLQYDGSLSTLSHALTHHQVVILGLGRF
jgi:hypothetical protein